MPSVFITGDVHHYLGNFEEEQNEWQHAGIYEAILADHGAVGTLFVTGKCILAHKEFWKQVQLRGILELGGHTHSALMPVFMRQVWMKLRCPRYGPWPYQWFDIKRTVKAFSEIGVTFKAWRTHSYASDQTTYGILARSGVSVVSDWIFEEFCLKRIGGIVHLPISSLPDGKIHKYYRDGDRGKVLAHGEKVMQSILERVQRRHDMVLQLHPVCMSILDGFKTFRSIVKSLQQAKYLFCKASDILPQFSEQR